MWSLQVRDCLTELDLGATFSQEQKNMAVTGMHFTSFFAFSGGEDAFSGSVTFSFTPTFAVAQTSLSEVTGDGMSAVFIRRFERRPKPNGPNHTVHLGTGTPSVDDPHMTEVTAEILLFGSDQGATATLNVWFFS